MKYRTAAEDDGSSNCKPLRVSFPGFIRLAAIVYSQFSIFTQATSACKTIFPFYFFCCSTMKLFKCCFSFRIAILLRSLINFIFVNPFDGTDTEVTVNVKCFNLFGVDLFGLAWLRISFFDWLLYCFGVMKASTLVHFLVLNTRINPIKFASRRIEKNNLIPYNHMIHHILLFRNYRLVALCVVIFTSRLMFIRLSP